MIDGVSKLTWGLCEPVYCRSVQRADARARACSRARARARPRAVLSTIDKSPCLAWKPKCALSSDRWGIQVHMGPLRARLLSQRTTRRRALYYPQIEKSPCWHWKLKCALSGDRWDFQLNMGPLRTRLLPQRTTRRRARVVLSTIEKTPCWPGIRSVPLAVADGISKLTWGLYVPFYCRSAQRADARAVLSTIEKSPCWLGK